MRTLRVLAILQNMWDPRMAHRGQSAPALYKINPRNVSGRRLHLLLPREEIRSIDSWQDEHGMPADLDLWVTNASSEVGKNANDHKLAPDLAQLAQAVDGGLPWDLILVCGRHAQKAARMLTPPVQPNGVRTAVVLDLPHPAARNWSHALLAEKRKEILGILMSRYLSKGAAPD